MLSALGGISILNGGLELNRDSSSKLSIYHFNLVSAGEDRQPSQFYRRLRALYGLTAQVTRSAETRLKCTSSSNVWPQPAGFEPATSVSSQARYQPYREYMSSWEVKLRPDV